MIKGVIIAFICFLFFVFSHILIFHQFRIKRHFYLMVKLFFSFLLVYIALFLVTSKDQFQGYIQLIMPIWLFGLLNGVFLQYFFFHFYLHFIQIVDRSPSTRILVEIDASPNKGLTLQELMQRYSIDEKITNELNDMVILGRLDKTGNFYINNKKGRLHCRIFKFVRDYLNLEKT